MYIMVYFILHKKVVSNYPIISSYLSNNVNPVIALSKLEIHMTRIHICNLSKSSNQNLIFWFKQLQWVCKCKMLTTPEVVQPSEKIMKTSL